MTTAVCLSVRVFMTLLARTKSAQERRQAEGSKWTPHGTTFVPLSEKRGTDPSLPSGTPAKIAANRGITEAGIRS
jgi:hypothetical protein